MTLLNCGHHPPLLLDGAHSAASWTRGRPSRPSASGPEPGPVTCQLAEGERLLFYTDGLVE